MTAGALILAMTIPILAGAEIRQRFFSVEQVPAGPQRAEPVRQLAGRTGDRQRPPSLWHRSKKFRRRDPCVWRRHVRTSDSQPVRSNRRRQRLRGTRVVSCAAGHGLGRAATGESVRSERATRQRAEVFTRSPAHSSVRWQSSVLVRASCRSRSSSCPTCSPCWRFNFRSCSLAKRCRHKRVRPRPPRNFCPPHPL